MNKSKKIKRAAVETGLHDKKKDKIVSSKVLTIASIVFVIILVGALVFDQFYESTYLKVDGKNYHLKDLSYYIYSVEYQYDYYDQMFGGNGTYWNMSADESGATMRDIAKEEAIETALYNEVLYNEAIAEGYSLTDEEKATIDTNADKMMESLTDAIIDQSNFTKEYLSDVLGKTALVTRYRQDKVDALDIDDEGITAGISRDEFRQYDIEYLFASKKTTDAEGKSVDKTEDEKTKAKDALNTYYEQAKTTEDWSKIIPADDETVSYTTDNFIASDTTFDDEFEAQIMAMENGAIGEVQETESGYYAIRMIDNDSSESYDKAVEDAITAAENEGFTAVYEEILAKHEYKINQTALNSLSMGSITLAK
ncbi:MAG: putative rane protein [Herbinix sp.]|nr:putative rane protein [Herbinix sp.]